ncbi:hypothetical protein [Citrobacter freundii]|uniref:hypothetical protein n=1 Tax=Citrobacter freundii TaxID=546 RepID=UPI001FFE10B7|nr:hypothetical protein [Citrobacter freundii]
MGSCAAPSAKGDDKFITTDYLQQCPFTIATAPQMMMKRTAATLETSTIVKDAGKENRYHES